MSEKPRSKYFSELDELAKKRYDDKIKAIGVLDPYCHLEVKGKTALVVVVDEFARCHVCRLQLISPSGIAPKNGYSGSNTKPNSVMVN